MCLFDIIKNEKINSKEHLLRSQIMLPNHSNKNNYDTGAKTDMQTNESKLKIQYDYASDA